MGFTPKLCLIKVLCLIEMRVEISGEVEEDEEIIRESRVAMHLVGLVKMYKELALTAREARECLGRDTVAWWHHDNDAIMEWNGMSKRRIFIQSG